MKTNDFDFHLPEQLIAQTPLKKRDSSRLLVAYRKAQMIKHDYFSSIVNYLNKGDCLVLNDTRVIPGRLYGKKGKTGANIELLLLTEVKDRSWEVLVKPARKIKEGDQITFGQGKLLATCTKEKHEGRRLLTFQYEGNFYDILDELGHMPLPPYIKQTLADDDRYQTIYAREEGSAAAPTEGLHFTNDILKQLKNKGVYITSLTLHVGLGTFRPVTVDHIKDHKMHAEYYRMNEETAELLTHVKKNNGRIFAVRTTSTRVLETIIRKYHTFTATTGWTDIFIYPPYEFKAIDGLITNFHLPQSTLLMLVSALLGKEFTFQAYEEAIAKKYRFFSFGDAMLILP